MGYERFEFQGTVIISALSAGLALRRSRISTSMALSSFCWSNSIVLSAAGYLHSMSTRYGYPEICMAGQRNQQGRE